MYSESLFFGVNMEELKIIIQQTDDWGSFFMGEGQHIVIGVNRPRNGGESTPFRYGVILMRSPKNKPLEVVPPGERQRVGWSKRLCFSFHTPPYYLNFFYILFEFLKSCHSSPTTH